MLAIEDVVGAPAVAGVATRKSFFSSAAATGHPQDANHYHLATIDQWRLCRLPYPTFWFPIVEVWDFLDGDEYKAAVGNCRARLAKPGSIEFEIRTASAMLDVASTSSFRKRRCVC